MENTSKVKNIFVILNSSTNKIGMSGSDKIYIKLGEELLKNGVKYHFLTNPDGFKMISNSSSKKFDFKLINKISTDSRHFFKGYFLRITFSYKILFLKIPKNSVLIASSDFLTDTIPLFILFLKYGRQNLYFTSMFLRKELSKTSNISDLIYKLSQKITIYITKICKFRIFTNKIDVNYLRNRGIKGSMVKVLPGGVDNINLIPNKKYDACFIGRIHPQKGIPVLLKIWKKFIQKNPQAILAFICSGNKEEIVSLKNQIKKLGLQSNIKFFGFLDNQDKLQVLANSKMFLFPSSYESFGITVLEALSLKIPVVSFDLDAVKINFKEGVLISKNEKEFLTNIEKLNSDSGLRDSLGNLGYKLSLNFTWKKIATQFLNDLV